MTGDIIPSVFENEEFGSLRVIQDEGGEPWFVAKDITDALGLDRTATRRLDDDEKGVRSTHTPGGSQEMTFVTEAGFYSLVLASKKPEARAFKRWVTHEVLPQIRKTGGYIPATADDDEKTILARAVLIGQRTMEEQKATIARQGARIAALEPRAGMFDACMDGERWQSFTEASRLLHQYDGAMTRTRLFELAMRDGVITRDKQASRYGIDRGYVANYQPPAFFDQTTGEQVRPRPYAKVTSKGLAWMAERYCKSGGAR